MIQSSLCVSLQDIDKYSVHVACIDVQMLPVVDPAFFKVDRFTCFCNVNARVGSGFPNKFWVKCGRQTARHHKITRTRQHTQTASVHTRAGALTFPSSCLDGGVTRVGPGRNPQNTRAWLAREAVGCSQKNHHRAQPRQPMSPTTLLTRR